MGSDGDDVGDARRRPDPNRKHGESELEWTRRVAVQFPEYIESRMDARMNALQEDIIRIGTRAADHERNTNERVEHFGQDVKEIVSPILERMDKRNELLARMCDHTMRLLSAVGDAPVKVLREVRQSVLLSAGFAILTIAAAAALLGVDIAEIMFGENYGVKFVQKPGNDVPADFGEPVKAEPHVPEPTR